MESRKAKYYKVSIYEKTIMGEYHLEEARIIYDEYEAIGYGISEEEKGNKVIIEEVTRVYTSNFINK